MEIILVDDMCYDIFSPNFSFGYNYMEIGFSFLPFPSVNLHISIENYRVSVLPVEIRFQMRSISLTDSLTY